MAKKTKTKVNVSKLIRDYLDANPDAKPSEICEHLLNDHKTDVSPQYVSTIKSNTKRRMTSLISDDPAVARLQMAKEFCSRLGGIEEALRAIRDYAALIN